MQNEINALIELREIKSGLEREIERIDLIINQLTPKNNIEATKIANEEMIGFYRYKKCRNDRERLLFVIQKMGKCTENDIYKYLQILDENQSRYKLKKMITNTIKILIDIEEIKQEYIREKINYSIIHV
ncbi:MAG: hypothetical protein ABIP95_15435 [Pelobium sp.]